MGRRICLLRTADPRSWRHKQAWFRRARSGARRDLQRRGLGSLLLTERLAMIGREPHVRAVVLDTSQHSRAFYERHGFQPFAETREGYGPGLDRIDMRLELQAGAAAPRKS